MDREEHIDSVGDEEEYQEIHKLASERHLSNSIIPNTLNSKNEERILIKTPSQLRDLKRRKQPKEDKYSIALSVLFNENGKNKKNSFLFFFFFFFC